MTTLHDYSFYQMVREFEGNLAYYTSFEADRTYIFRLLLNPWIADIVPMLPWDVSRIQQWGKALIETGACSDISLKSIVLHRVPAGANIGYYDFSHTSWPAASVIPSGYTDIIQAGDRTWFADLVFSSNVAETVTASHFKKAAEAIGAIEDAPQSVYARCLPVGLVALDPKRQIGDKASWGLYMQATQFWTGRSPYYRFYRKDGVPAWEPLYSSAPEVVWKCAGMVGGCDGLGFAYGNAIFTAGLQGLAVKAAAVVPTPADKLPGTEPPKSTDPDAPAPPGVPPLVSLTTTDKMLAAGVGLLAGYGLYRWLGRYIRL